MSVKVKEVTTDQGVIKVHKLAIGDYAAVFKKLDKIPGHIAGLMDTEDEKLKSNEFLFQALPPILAESLDEFVGILALATDQSKEAIAKLDLEETVRVLEAVIEVNKYEELSALVKKVLGGVMPANRTERRVKPKTPPAEPST